ncbi:MAG: PEP-CTERM sorting domain-containing protein [Opitutaceae bacterium]
MKKSILTLTTGLFVASLSQAAIVASYDFEEGSLEASFEQFGTAGDATFGSAFSTATAATLTPFGDGSVNTDGLLYNSGIGTAAPGDASNQVVMTFTVGGLDTGHTLQFDSVQIDFAGTSNTTRFHGFLDGASIRSGGNFNPPASGTYIEALNISSAAATTGQTVFSNGDTFSVAFGTRENGGGNTAFDNFVINGTVIVPEPSSYALLAGLVGLSAVMLRRRQA